MWIPSFVKVLFALFIIGLIIVVGYKFIYPMFKEKVSGEVK
ncbi:hypothetical protein [Acidianus bottle-shaped virus 3 strain ABV3]|uniref:Uncharacterized protein n=1 Tax=Acidianus bottle-shaped virus 3 strain ABV3 TaxID=1732174 RepID=A0A0N9P6G9_9VIRU|nr:hypothetical protein AVU00_gp12 [Acidianus bottle-shaped virus 3 strain ABV3]ALG96814.1 hypothetical protein [Acidianus bottle-shaped virus 3 strain ABV3]